MDAFLTVELDRRCHLLYVQFKNQQKRENILMVKNGVRIVVTAGHLRIMVTTEGV